MIGEVEYLEINDVFYVHVFVSNEVVAEIFPTINFQLAVLWEGCSNGIALQPYKTFLFESMHQFMPISWHRSMLSSQLGFFLSTIVNMKPLVRLSDGGIPPSTCHVRRPLKTTKQRHWIPGIDANI